MGPFLSLVLRCSIPVRESVTRRDLVWNHLGSLALQKRREEFVLHLKASELISMVELILAEAETRYQNTDEASCTLIQSRLPLLLSCSHGDLENIKKVTEYLTSCIQQWGSR